LVVGGFTLVVGGDTLMVDDCTLIVSGDTSMIDDPFEVSGYTLTSTGGN
jgi:hypothetical protein